MQRSFKCIQIHFLVVTLYTFFSNEGYWFGQVRSEIHRECELTIEQTCSGGKDSCYNMMQCVAHGHEITALANLKPPQQSGKGMLERTLTCALVLIKTFQMNLIATCIRQLVTTLFNAMQNVWMYLYTVVRSKVRLSNKRVTTLPHLKTRLRICTSFYLKLWYDCSGCHCETIIDVYRENRKSIPTLKVCLLVQSYQITNAFEWNMCKRYLDIYKVQRAHMPPFLHKDVIVLDSSHWPIFGNAIKRSC